MRDLNTLNRFRRRDAHVLAFLGTVGGADQGIFMLPSPVPTAREALIASTVFRPKFMVIATTEGGWDHVPVSLQARCPSWEEMDAIKRLFFRPDEVAMQLHVPPAEHINMHPYCLHIWRPQGAEIPLPPPEMVGLPSLAGAR